MRRAILPAAAVIGFVSLGLAQAPQSTFRAGVDLVQVDVSVLDKDRHPVRGLTAADFTLLEDGKPRPIAAFTAVDLPARALPAAAWVTETPSAATNTAPQEGRLVVIVLDRSISEGFATINAKNIARAAVREMGPSDLGAVLFTRTAMQQGFTNDRAKLLSAIDRGSPAGETSAEFDERWADLMAGMQQPGNFTSDALVSLEFGSDCQCGVCVLDTIRNIADSLRTVDRRRKVVLFIGTELQIETTASACVDRVHDARGRLYRSLDLANVTVHSFDPLGLAASRSTASLRRSGFVTASPRIDCPSGSGSCDGVRQETLAALPDRTGGRFVKNTNEPATLLPQIFAESESYYLLGFPPTTNDGKRHDINVKVDRRGLDVRTRRGYVAPGMPESSTGSYVTADDAIRGALPIRNGVSVSATVATFAAPSTHDPIVIVSLHAEHDPAASTQSSVNTPERVNVVTAVFSMTGRAIGTLRQTLAVASDRTKDGAVTYDVLQKLPARPGRYELRIGVENETRHQTGSVYQSVDVPTYSAAFEMSDIAVFLPNTRPATAEDLSTLLLAPTTATRAFAATERPTAFLRVYQERDRTVPVRMTTSVIDQHNRKLFGQESSVEPSAFADGAADYVVNLPAADLDPGEYLLRIDGTRSGTDAHRELRFVIR